MREVLKVLARRMIPWTSYPLESNSSARYEPSCPVMPVTSARFMRLVPFKSREAIRRCETQIIRRLFDGGLAHTIILRPRGTFVARTLRGFFPGWMVGYPEVAVCTFAMTRLVLS